MLTPKCARPLISPTIRMAREFEANDADCCGKANGTPSMVIFRHLITEWPDRLC